MPTLTITKSYADGDTLFEADLDNIKDDIENFLNVTKINDDNIQSAGITGSTKLVDASVSSAKLASASVTTSKIADEAVTDAKIQSGGLLAASIASNAVTTAKILDSNVTTAKIADAAVTQAKRAALGQQISSSCGTFSTTSTSLVDVTNLSVSITTTGRPVYISCVSDGSGSASDWGTLDGSGVGTQGFYIIVAAIIRGSTEVARHRISSTVTMASASVNDALGTLPVTTISTVDTPSAGTYTYKVQIAVSSSTSADIRNAKLIAFEL